jgi:hypothetical protein
MCEGDRRVNKIYGVVAFLIKYKCVETIFLSSLGKATGTEKFIEIRTTGF